MNLALERLAWELGTLELPGGETANVQKVAIQSWLHAMAPKLELNFRLVRSHQFSAHRARHASTGSTDLAVRPSGRQSSASNRCASLLTEHRFVGHVVFRLADTKLTDHRFLHDFRIIESTLAGCSMAKAPENKNPEPSTLPERSATAAES